MLEYKYFRLTFGLLIHSTHIHLIGCTKFVSDIDIGLSKNL